LPNVVRVRAGKRVKRFIVFLDDDNNVPATLIIAGKIPGAWLVQLKNAGHALISQYPDKFNKVLQTFLSTTN
jgi:pimeloyl-ACP methyl ester carboxylesterase